MIQLGETILILLLVLSVLTLTGKLNNCHEEKHELQAQLETQSNRITFEEETEYIVIIEEETTFI